jgi:phospholipid/cholesterol/gamma-HCH transport system permease protein
MMAGIVMSGRTGAAFAAELGTMQVTQEIDAFKTFSISAVEFLVLPRVLALVLMMPLLVVFADLLGVAGGFIVGLGMLDLSFREYYNETVDAITLTQFFIGIGKGAVFGVIVALTGCLRGLQCGRDSAAVGQAATSAAVTGITWIIIADAVFAVLFNLLGI